MDINTSLELKHYISNRAGINIDCLRGDTPEEILASARNASYWGTTRELFEAWASGNTADFKALDQIEKVVSRSPEGYPVIVDDPSLEDPRSTRDQFAEWVNDKL